MQNQTQLSQTRDISSSEDRCKCTQCRNQQDLLLNHKKPLPNIQFYRHLKKREGPPNKKDFNKDVIVKSKLLLKNDSEAKQAATPVKRGPERSKEATLTLIASEYHMVSQSQRQKPPKESQTLS